MNNGIIQKRELSEKLFNLKNKEDKHLCKNTQNSIESSCYHEISLEEISCFWGGISISNKCIFCGDEIKSNDDEPLLTFQIFYDEFGDIIEPNYSLAKIYMILEKILEKFDYDDEIDLIKEIELLNLDNVKINREQKNKVRKRQV